MWGQHQNIKNQISQHFADRCLGIRENIGKLFIIILASLIWLIICWHQDRSNHLYIFTEKIRYFWYSQRTFTVRNPHKPAHRSPNFMTRRLWWCCCCCWLLWWTWSPKYSPRRPSWALEGNRVQYWREGEVKQAALIETDLIICSVRSYRLHQTTPDYTPLLWLCTYFVYVNRIPLETPIQRID